MYPYMETVFFAAGIILLFLLWILYEDRKRRKIIRRKIRRIYGNVPEREYSPGDIETISHYFRRKAGENFFIDDITWNDLDMDRVYMLINQTMSSPGEDVLYEMLRTPVFDKTEMDRREKLIRFFADNPEKREEMEILLSAVGKTRYGSLSDTILALEDAKEVAASSHWIMLFLLVAALGSIPVWPVYGFLSFILLSCINVVFYYVGKDRAGIEAYLECFSSLLRMLGIAARADTVNWPETREHMERIRKGVKAFASIKRKAFFLTGKNDGTGNPAQILMDYLRMVFHLDILVYNSVLREVRGKSEEIMGILDSLGELDALISVASFREMLPQWCRPDFTEWTSGHIKLCVEDLYHPLISEPVANSITAENGILVTGSNASGKSTFLKNIALNSILAQTIFTCTAASYRAPFLKVMTSMALRDDLTGGESYFIVEIRSLKRILDESNRQEPLLCIIDEVLRGTNTVERIAASSSILKALDHDWVLPVAATHDIELSYILEKRYRNFHFEEEVLDDGVVFDYLLRLGRAVTRNAIKLLKLMDYDKKIVTEASDAAEEFEKNGVWSEVSADKEE